MERIDRDCSLLTNFIHKNIPYIQLLIFDVSVDIIHENIKILIGKNYYLLKDIKYNVVKVDDNVELTMSIDAFTFLHSVLLISAATDSRSSHNIFNSISKYISHIFHQYNSTYSVIFAFSRLIHKDRRRHRGLLDVDNIYINMYRKLNSILELVEDINDDTLDALHAFINLDDGHIIKEGFEKILGSLSDNKRYHPFLKQLSSGVNLNNIMYPVNNEGMIPGHIIYYKMVCDYDIKFKTRLKLFLNVRSDVKRIAPLFRVKKLGKQNLNNINLKFEDNIDRVFYLLENRNYNKSKWYNIISPDRSVNNYIPLQKFYNKFPK